MYLPNPMCELHIKAMKTPEVTSGLGQTDRLGFPYAPGIQEVECEMIMSYTHYPKGLDLREELLENRYPS